MASAHRPPPVAIPTPLNNSIIGHVPPQLQPKPLRPRNMCQGAAGEPYSRCCFANRVTTALFKLLRARAHTQTDPDARAAGFGAALDLARRQGAPLFELRAALDDFELRGQPAREALSDAASRLVSDSDMPELARAREMLGK